MTPRRALKSAIDVPNHWGLLRSTERLVSGRMDSPPTWTTSVVATLKPIVVMISPFTITAPDSMSTSASRLEQMPALETNRFNRMGALLFGNAFLAEAIFLVPPKA